MAGWVAVKHVFIGLPIYRSMEAGTVLSLLGLINHPPEGFHFTPILISLSDIVDSRNVIAKTVKDYPSPEKSALLFIDSDMQFTREDFMSLYTLYEDGGWGILAAHATRKSYPFPSCYKPVMTGDSGKVVINCEWVGMGLTLIKPEILNKLDETPFSPHAAHTIADSESEDVAFCRRARGVGYKIGCAINIKISHIGEYGYGVWDQERVMEDARRAGSRARS